MHGKLVCFRQLLVLNLALVSLWLSGCDGGSSSTPLGNSSKLTLNLSPVKTLTLNWTAVAGASHYNLYERLNPDSDARLLNTTEIPASQRQFQQPIALHTRLNARYQLDACQGKNCKLVAEAGFDDIDQLNAAIGYVKASDTGGFTLPGGFVVAGNFGQSLALSDDGRTLAIGALNSAESELNSAGLVYMFHRTEAGQWREAIRLYANNANSGDNFAGVGDASFTSLSLSDDGSTLAVGAINEAGGDADDPTSNESFSSGAVYVFRRSAEVWNPIPDYLKSTVNGHR